jgi:cytochrome P450
MLIVKSITANDEDHRRFRRLQSHAFSEKALSAQEGYLQQYVRTFISGLHDQINSENKGVVTISDWFNFTTFDLIGDLTFGHSFGCTESGKLHPWVAVTFDYIKAMEYNRISRIFPAVAFIASLFVPKSLKETVVNHAAWSAERTQERLKIKTDRKDFMSYMLAADADKAMSNDELNEASTILILAGSETVSFRIGTVGFPLTPLPRQQIC